jgi:hypothetical protein
MLGVPSSCIKDFEILNHAKECSDYLVLYTDSCTQKEIDLAIEACQPDMVIHHSHGDARIDYLKYLQGISIEFDKRYRVGYKNRPDESSALMVAAYMLDSDFLEHTIEINDNNYSLYLDSGAPNSYTDLVIDLEEINRSRGGYEARKLSNIEKELRRK